MRRLGAVLTVLVLVLGVTGRAMACPNCKEAVAAQPSDLAGMQQGYNYSVLFMMSMPFTLLGTGAIMIARAIKKGTLPEM